MKNIFGNSRIFFSIAILGILALETLMGCGSGENASFFDKVKASPLDGSVKVVESFLKNNYLRDPDSYKSREWGKLIKNSDGTFQVSHRFSAKNGFGAFDTETFLFCISADGTEVNICNSADRKRIAQSEKKAKEDEDNSDYEKKNFSNVSFIGILTETIDGIGEKSTFRGQLTKRNDLIQGTIEAVEKETKYSLTGKIIGDGEIILELNNLSIGSVITMKGFIKLNQVSAYSPEHNVSFYLIQND